MPLRSARWRVMVNCTTAPAASWNRSRLTRIGLPSAQSSRAARAGSAGSALTVLLAAAFGVRLSLLMGPGAAAAPPLRVTAG